ncbi:MAG: hypothetical protein ABI689_12470 [Thermoanaerobaculia bacterium]
MQAYIWILELAAVGGLFLFGRWIWHKMHERKAQAAHAVKKQGSVASRAERDRLDIEKLTRGMTEAERIPGTETVAAGAARQERGRRAATHSTFDPDLPARPDKPDAGA